MADRLRPDRPSTPRALVVLLCAAGAVITLAGLKAIASVAGPMFLALVLVIAVAPVRSWLVARRAPTWVLVAAPLLVILVVLLAMGAVLTVSIAQLASLAPDYSAEFARLVDQLQALAQRFGISTQQVDQAINSFNPTQVIGLVQGLFSGLLGVASSLFLIVVLVLAMCLDAAGFARIMSSGSGQLPGLASALAKFAERTRRYLLVSTVFGLLNATLNVVALYLLGVPLPLLWGVLSLITIYIPNIGFVIGMVPPAVLGLLQGGPRTMIGVILAYMAINVVTQSFILPKFLGDAVELSTTMTFLSLLLWTFVIGPLGAVLAIPLSLLARALLVDSDPSATWAAAFISGRPPPKDRPPPKKT
ncbi:AI-2E family transporter [Spongiactinospora sp. TRM90649]|uniref:AI-2E family transporter n=1 Tax=Spongiactinospora sp. TRM90649 TaxID=3031114 RepID=UPI0023F66595|nr:AI-2E family transporter [Spongiactinospora sp. TRM90649]MDF5752775.1 AI-2E family transporter [Spongiactinospora sp. TRM90649]